MLDEFRNIRMHYTTVSNQAQRPGAGTSVLEIVTPQGVTILTWHNCRRFNAVVHTCRMEGEDSASVQVRLFGEFSFTADGPRGRH